MVAAYRSGTPPGPGGQERGRRERAGQGGLRAPGHDPPGSLRCPRLNGVSYRLAFSMSGHLLPAVVVQPSGCQTVTGAGVVRTAAGRPAFLKLLAGMAGVLRLPGAAHLPGSSGSPAGPVRLPAGPSRPPAGRGPGRAGPARLRPVIAAPGRAGRYGHNQP